MVVVPCTPEQITLEDLLAIYRAYCDVYSVDCADGERALKSYGLDRLRDEWGLDFRPFMGAKFFGQRRVNGTEFWGYAETENYGREHSETFDRMVVDYFSSRNHPSSS